MDFMELVAHLRGHDGTAVSEDRGNLFFIHDPDGTLPPERSMPWATIVVADAYDTVSDLDDAPGTYRLNLGLTKDGYTTRFGAPPTERDADWVLVSDTDYAARDTVMPHPLYAAQHWICVVNPSGPTLEALRPLITEAHDFAARKYARYRAKEASA